MRSIAVAILAPLVCAPVVGCNAGRERPATPEARRVDSKPRLAGAATPRAAARVVRRPLPTPIRAMWVARMHYRYPDDVRTIVRNCAALGINTIFWQVRGDGTVCYPSSIEPWASQFDFHDPGFDPLALAVEEAHAHGIRIEAWVNVVPGWRGPKPPPILNQLYAAHPEWFIRDDQDRPQPLHDDFYVILNPCLPEVRRYLTEIVREIVLKYDVDGVHLDYIRFAWDTTPDAKKRFPRDGRTVQLYQRETRRLPDDDVAAWDLWRATQVSRVVLSIRGMLRRDAPSASLTAAVHANPANAYRAYLQNGAFWLSRGWVDALVPMVYSGDLDKLRADLAAYEHLTPGGRIVPGLGIYKLTPAGMRRQLQFCVDRGGDFALFSYTTLHASHDDRTGGTTGDVRAARALKRDTLRAFVAP